MGIVLSYALDSKRILSISPRRAVADQAESIRLTPRVKTMEYHPGVKPALWGALAGAVAISVIGFSSMGWMLGSKAERLASERADNAVVAVLTPICVEKFQKQTNSAAKLIEFKKIASWDQRALIAKDGWATTPGGEAANSAVASACAEKLGGGS